MFKKTLIAISTGILLLLPISKALASPGCPVCTVAVISGIGLSRWLGIDDSISGLWIGALLIVLSYWTTKWLNRKNINFKGLGLLTLVVYYISILIPLYLQDIAGHPFNKIWGIDKLVFGLIAGAAVFYSGVLLSDYLKKRNDGKAYFPFQKVVLPISPLIIISIVFYLIK